MNQDLKKKIIGEQTLTAEEALRLDQALEDQATVARLMAGLDEVSPSLAWRSSLNEKLHQQYGHNRRQSALRWVTGFAAAATVTMVLMTTLPQSDRFSYRSEPVKRLNMAKKDGPGVEESLLTAHHEADIESGLGVSEEASFTSVSGT